jgi:uncharacterized Zn finger protein
VSPRWSAFPAYVSAAERQARAARAAARLGRRTPGLEPVLVTGRKVARSFWGQAWCRHLETYSDFATRLPRGRSYLRGGAVVDLKLTAGEVRSQVAGTRLYTVAITIDALPGKDWRALTTACGGQVDSLVALLEGRLPDEVMRLVTDPARGLFPRPRQIQMTCTCPDAAVMCKHVAATLYGVGVRLDDRPELLFVLRRTDPGDLVHAAASAVAAVPRTMGDQSLEELFGIDLAPAPPRRKRAARR